MKTKSMKTKTMSTKSPYAVQLEDLPNFSITGSISGMKKLWYGQKALLIRCGAYIYNATSKPDLYHFSAN